MRHYSVVPGRSVPRIGRCVPAPSQKTGLTSAGWFHSACRDKAEPQKVLPVKLLGDYFVLFADRDKASVSSAVWGAWGFYNCPEDVGLLHNTRARENKLHSFLFSSSSSTPFRGNADLFCWLRLVLLLSELFPGKLRT